MVKDLNSLLTSIKKVTMPEIKQFNIIEISPEKFLDACSPEELQELHLLLDSPKYWNKIKHHCEDLNEIHHEESTDGNQQHIPK